MRRCEGMRIKALKAAVPKVLPICVSFFFLAMSYGVLMGTRGFSFLWPMCMSAFIFTGSMEFVTVNLLISAFNPFATLMLAVMMGTRHLFYGLAMLGKFKHMGFKKFYLIYAMCDETFAVNSSARIPDDVDRGWFYFFVSLLNQASWVSGATIGGIIGGRLTFSTEGLDFVMTALFVVIFVDQWMNSKRKSHMAALTGIVVPVICLSIFGADNFMVPALAFMLVAFFAFRPYLDDLKAEERFDEQEGRA
jgi:4-azaleucine resistance transporter AzlC